MAVESDTSTVALSAWKELQHIRQDPVASLSASKGPEIAHLHQVLSEEGIVTPTPAIYHRNGVAVPDYNYWGLPSIADGSVFSESLNKGLNIKSGALSSFSVGERALLVDAASRVYADRLLDLPKWANRHYAEDPRRAEMWIQNKQMELLVTMCREFRDDHVAAYVWEYSEQGERIILGSIGAVHGVGNRRVVDTIGFDGMGKKPASSVPTNFALDYALTDEAKSMLDGVQEHQTSELTRLYQSKPRTSPLVTAALYSAIGEAIDSVTPDVQFLVFNTQPELGRAIRRMGFPTVSATENVDEIRPTPGILNTVHGIYYSNIYMSDDSHRVVPQILDFSKGLARSREILSAMKS